MTGTAIGLLQQGGQSSRTMSLRDLEREAATSGDPTLVVSEQLDNLVHPCLGIGGPRQLDVSILDRQDARVPGSRKLKGMISCSAASKSDVGDPKGKESR